MVRERSPAYARDRAQAYERTEGSFVTQHDVGDVPCATSDRSSSSLGRPHCAVNAYTTLTALAAPLAQPNNPRIHTSPPSPPSAAPVPPAPSPLLPHCPLHLHFSAPRSAIHSDYISPPSRRGGGGRSSRRIPLRRASRETARTDSGVRRGGIVEVGYHIRGARRASHRSCPRLFTQSFSHRDPLPREDVPSAASRALPQRTRSTPWLNAMSSTRSRATMVARGSLVVLPGVKRDSGWRIGRSRCRT